jgi:Protein prenyltransferase alpha subunit repeat
MGARKKQCHNQLRALKKDSRSFCISADGALRTAAIISESDIKMADVLADIDKAFEVDPVIDEIGIIMSPPPPNLVLIDHKLGLSFKILKPLFEFAINELYTVIRSAKMSKEMLSNPIVSEKVLRLTRAILLVRADMPMLYNLRKTIILAGSTTHSIDAELNFLGVLFTKHPKSPSSWQHRRWCLTTRWSYAHCKSSTFLQVELSSCELEVELALCSAMSESYPKNYYSWLHRLWLLQYMEFAQLKSELNFTRAWLTSHVSDHSASNHRVQVILRIISLISDFKSGEESQSSGPECLNDNKALGLYLSSFLCGASIEEVLGDSSLSHAEELRTSINDNDKDKDNNEDNNKDYSYAMCDKDMYSKRSGKASHNVMKFLEYVFHESKELVVLRPGSETLWGLLRAVANLVLENIPRSRKKESHQCHVKASSIGKSSYLDSTNFTINLESVNSEALEKNTSNNGFESQNEIYDSVKLSAVDETITDIQQYGVIWLAEWLKNETAFCQNCVDNVYAWNYETHRQMALRYCCFIQQRILVHFSHPSSSLAVIHVAHQQHQQQQEQEQEQGSHKSDDVSRGHDKHSLGLFINAVRLSLQNVSRQLEIEGNVLSPLLSSSDVFFLEIMYYQINLKPEIRFLHPLFHRIFFFFFNICVDSLPRHWRHLNKWATQEE